MNDNVERTTYKGETERLKIICKETECIIIGKRGIPRDEQQIGDVKIK